MEKIEYWKKLDNLKSYEDLKWNIPEQKSGTISLIGGNLQNFSSIIRTAEFIQKTFPIAKLNIVLPDSLKSKLPPLPDVIFTKSTESGSFAKSDELNDTLERTDFAILLGDLSKNSATEVAVAEAIKNSDTRILLTRDGIDLILTEMGEIIERDGLFILASMAQLQKLFRAVYYLKMLLLSMPLMPVVETLHKFTLSYKTTILTFHQEQIIVANNGNIVTVPIAATDYTPLSLWNGTLASKISIMNLYNPGKEIDATLSAIN